MRYIPENADYFGSAAAHQVKHAYTLHLHRCIYTPELAELSKKYEKAVHKRDDQTDKQVRQFMCDSPLYNAENEEEAALPCKPEMVGLNDDLPFKEEDLYPGPGSYHMYHRIDGRLVAVGVVDIGREVFNSAYFMYDPEFKWLNLGVVGALIEMEYMKLIQRKFNPHMKYYQLGELNINCPKVNYKLNYGPGALILCPQTKVWVPYEEVQGLINKICKLSVQEKH